MDTFLADFFGAGEKKSQKKILEMIGIFCYKSISIGLPAAAHYLCHDKKHSNMVCSLPGSFILLHHQR